MGMRTIAVIAATTAIWCLAGCQRERDPRAAARIAELEAEVKRLEAGGEKAPAKVAELRPFRPSTDLVRLPDPNDPSLADPLRLRPGTYRLAIVQRVNEHVSPKVGYRSSFRHDLVVPGRLDNLDRTDRSVDWGTVDYRSGWVSQLAVHLPLTVTVGKDGVSAASLDYYWQQLGWRRAEGGDAGGPLWSWGSGNQSTFREWQEVAAIFEPKNRSGRVYRLEGPAAAAAGFETGRGAVRADGNALMLLVEMVKDDYRTTLLLGYQRP